MDGSSEKVEKVYVKHFCLSLSLDSCPNEWRSSCTRLRTPIFIGIRWKNQILKKRKKDEENLLLRTPKAHKQGIEAALNMDMLMHCFFKTNTLLFGFAKKMVLNTCRHWHLSWSSLDADKPLQHLTRTTLIQGVFRCASMSWFQVVSESVSQ